MIKILFVFILLMGLQTEASAQRVDYEVEGKIFEGHFVSPSAGAPLIIMVHDWDGLTDYERKRSSMLVELGYAVFAIDLYGKGIRPSTFDEKRKLSGDLYRDRISMRRRLVGALKAVATLGGNLENAVAIGYCFGGAVTLELARSGVNFKGFVSFHGGLATPDGQNYQHTHGKLLIMHGSADKNVSLQEFATLAAELEQYQINHEMITYSGAPHAFTIFNSDRYRADADKKSWQRFILFLAETLR